MRIRPSLSEGVGRGFYEFCTPCSQHNHHDDNYKQPGELYMGPINAGSQRVMDGRVTGYRYAMDDCDRETMEKARAIVQRLLHLQRPPSTALVIREAVWRVALAYG
jgi:hypothetical protein